MTAELAQSQITLFGDVKIEPKQDEDADKVGSFSVNYCGFLYVRLCDILAM